VASVTDTGRSERSEYAVAAPFFRYLELFSVLVEYDCVLLCKGLAKIAVVMMR
jgi:hypothetical protein